MRGSWTRRRALAVAAGGAAGAALRWAVLAASGGGGGGFPWAVLALNVAGSVVLGVLMAEEWSHPSARLVLHDLAGIGFCGGLTTFSTFAVEVADLAGDGRLGTAAVYGAASLVGAVVGVAAGAGALRRLRAVALPLEEEP